RHRPSRGADRDARPARPPPSSRRHRPAHRRPRGAVGRRMRRLIAVAALAVLGGCGSGPAQQGISLKIEKGPFRVTVLDNGRTVVAEDKDARLRYQLASTGDVYSLTHVTSSNGDVYQVATNEAGRTATVAVTRTPTGARIQLSVHPATDIQQ